MKTLANTMKPVLDLLASLSGLSQKNYLFAFMLTVMLAACSNEQDGITGTVDADAAPVVAKAGPIVAVRVGETPVLDGSRSKTSLAGSLHYHWSFAHKPYGSKAKLRGSNTENPTFVADVKGVYTVELVVSVDGISSQRTVQIVVVTTAGERLTGSANHPGLSSDCVTCHNGSLVDPGKSPDHIGTSNLCQACHTPQHAALIPYVDHQEVFGNCSQCHDGVIAIGKSDFHVPTQSECGSCHNTKSFLNTGADGKFDHTNITRDCSGCHNGDVATGKTASVLIGGTHPDTKAECISCHTTKSFLDAYPDHTDPAVIGNGCDSCHGVSLNDRPSDPPAGHPVVNLDCDSCHGIVSFSLGGVFNHQLVDAAVQPCESCHNDSTSINAPAKSSAVPTHVATTADCGSCHNTESFSPAFGFDHSDISSGCQNCHGNNSPVPPDVTASGKPPTTANYEHVPTNPDNPGTASDEDCAHCHTPGTFSTGTYDHAAITSSCNTCHDNRIGVGKLPSHIPTNPDDQDCADCHNSTVDFLDVSFSHAGIFNDCVSCHDGKISSGKPVGHIPTGQDCISCHSTTDPFRPAVNFAHLNISDNCVSCHSGKAGHAAVGAIGKNTTHIPAQNDCETCHDNNPGDFATAAKFMQAVHFDITGGCEGCHKRPFLPTPNSSNQLIVKQATHLPTTQDCDNCHENNNGFAAIDPLPHTGITGNCESCHDGSADNVTAGASGKAQATDHPATNSDCGTCHAIGNNFTDGSFDHSGIVDNCASCHGDTPTATPAGPKKNAGHVTSNEDCSVCHVPGTFTGAVFNHTGIIDNCASCHDGANAVGTVKTGSHLPTIEDCSLCHNTSAFAGAHFDHQGIVDNCATCHNGTTASGKTPPPDHVPTSQDCGVCHQTSGFLPATFDHTGIVDNCVSCHNGAFAQGKSASHVATSQDCGLCHTTSEPLSFNGAVFDHTGIVNNCESCHYDGGPGLSKSSKTNPPHLDTTLDCYHCHTTATFVGGSWVHDASTTGRCDDCHTSAGGATAKSNDHLDTVEQCDTCHSTDAWSPSSFRHSASGNYPGDHRRNPGCSGCHKASIGAGINSGNYPDQLIYAPFCAGCHAVDFRRKDKHIGGSNGTIEQNKNCGNSGCHSVSSSEF